MICYKMLIGRILTGYLVHCMERNSCLQSKQCAAVVSLNKELYSHWHGPVDPGNVRQLYNVQHAGSAGTLVC